MSGSNAPAPEPPAVATVVPAAVVEPTPTAPIASGNETVPVLHNITVDVAITSPGVHGPGGGFDPPVCAPSPTDCRTGVHERIDMADANVFNGTTMDWAWLYPDSVEQRTVAGVWVFTGSIVGCSGAGTVTMPWIGVADEDPVALNTNGDVIHEHDLVTGPTNSTGFVKIVEVRLDADFYLNPVGGSGHGRLTGYILCE